MDLRESFLNNKKPLTDVTTSEIQGLPASEGVGKPCSKRLLTASDYTNALVTASCFAIAIASVQSTRLAAYLGVQNQLIVLGLVLSVMSFITFRQMQALLIALEARFGESTLQNYDAIIRNDKLRSHISLPIRLALIVAFVLPLVLSVGYKRFSNGGHATVAQDTDNKQLTFGPSGPPQLYLADGIPGYVNATAPLYNKQPLGPSLPPAFPSSHGFTMQVINATHTAMLDSPLSSELTSIQASLQYGEVKRLSASVNATYASLNSIPTSPERADFDAYWSNFENQMGQEQFSMACGGGSWFGMWNGGVDMSLVFLSYFNTTLNQTFESEAIAFNIYRGSGKGTWAIAATDIYLEDASDFTTSWSPETPHPTIFGGGTSDCDPSATPEPSQALVTCFWNLLAFKFYTVASQYLVPIRRTWQGSEEDQLSFWVSSVAAMEWASLATNTVPAGTWTSGLKEEQLELIQQYPYLAYTGPYTITSTVITMRRGFGLCAVLSVQPLLFLAIIVARCLLYDVPVSDKFGITTLLAGASRSSLDVLDGAAFSGELTRKVRVQILVHDNDDAAGDGRTKNVEYLFDSAEKNSTLRKRKSGVRKHALLTQWFR